MTDQVSNHYLEDALANFRDYKKLAERAFDQVSDDEFFRALDEEANGIAVIMKHISGNMISRWTDFLTSDGEKPDRNRDMEFVITPETSRREVTEHWERGWSSLFAALEPLGANDLSRIVQIRGEDHTVVQAINRQLTHYAYHIGQIVFLSKHFRSSEWKSLSIPRNRSTEFNAYLAEKDEGERKNRFDAAQDFAEDDSKGLKA